jgi:Domain of unknown function (DUF397)
MDLQRAVWRKSSFSNGTGGACVEVADLDSGTWGVRDSKDPQGTVLRFPVQAWRAFASEVCEGRFS